MRNDVTFRIPYCIILAFEKIFFILLISIKFCICEICEICESHIAKDAPANVDICKLNVKCPYPTCEDECKLRQLPDHMRVCPKLPVDCVYKYVGCQEGMLLGGKYEKSFGGEFGDSCKYVDGFCEKNGE